MRLTPHSVSRAAGAGFTLIELLVVIAIIALLIGIMIPALGAARTAANLAKCKANLKSIATGLNIFADSHRGNFPTAHGIIAWNDNPGPNDTLCWPQQCINDVGSRQVYRCPCYPDSSIEFDYYLETNQAYMLSRPNPSPINRNMLRFSSSFVLCGDTNRYWDAGPSGEADCDKDDYDKPAIFWNGGGQYNLFHGGTLNLAFADCHADNFKSYDATTMTYRYDTMVDWSTNP